MERRTFNVSDLFFRLCLYVEKLSTSLPERLFGNMFQVPLAWGCRDQQMLGIVKSFSVCSFSVTLTPVYLLCTDK